MLGGMLFTVLLRTTADPLLPSVLRQWDVMLPFAVYFGQRRSLVEGGLLCLLGAHLYSLCSSAPMGFYLVVYLSLFGISRAVSSAFYANRWVTIIPLITVMALLGRGIFFLLGKFFEQPSGSFWEGGWVLWLLAVNAIAGYATYTCLLWGDRLTQKLPRAKIQLSEGSL